VLKRLLDPLRRRALDAASRVLPSAFPLARLGALYGTDKVDRWHTHLGRSNADVYAQYVKGWRRDRFSMLEIGVLDGASLRMWRSYFPRARITGLDIDPRVSAMEREGFRILVGSQTDEELLEKTVSPDLRFVIDDGSHVNELTIATFRYLFPRLPSGAIYVIEDTLNTYEPARIEWPGMECNRPGLNLDNKREDIDPLLLELQHDCDTGGPDRTVSFVHTWPGLILVGRA
jgi:demethylmacrocin O-methyltransferase